MANELRANYNGSATLYAIVRQRTDLYAWNGSAFETWADGNIATYDIPLTASGGDLYAADFPSGITTAGYYTVDYYKQAGGSPATSDYRLDGELIYWTGQSVSYGPTGTNLTTLAKVKEFMGISVSTYDDKLNSILTAVSRAVEKYLDTKVISESFIEYANGKDSWRVGYMHLNNSPVLAISRVATRPTPALMIRNTTATNQRATVAVTSTGITLTRVASGVSTSNTLTWASYVTLNLLASAINSLGSGWAATVAGNANDYGGWPTTLLKYIQGALDAKSEANVELYVEELGEYRIDETEGTLWGEFPYGYQNVEVRYTAGWATIPDDLQMGVASLVKSVFDASNVDGNMKSERIGDYSYTLKDGFSGDVYSSLLSPSSRMFLDPYKKVRVTF